MRDGLKRLSAVGWGFAALCWLFLIGSFYSASLPAAEQLHDLALAIGGLCAFFALHKLTCWLIGSPRPSNELARQ
ncbi:hypothetical protein VARIO8X_90041 [Burkholderiales bacterium 8X]|nr:hypothetical protein VARIO8X_90041 [Burkholderiales bacterium 8X]